MVGRAGTERVGKVTERGSGWSALGRRWRGWEASGAVLRVFAVSSTSSRDLGVGYILSFLLCFSVQSFAMLTYTQQASTGRPFRAVVW
jgi:hypothetical protein